MNGRSICVMVAVMSVAACANSANTASADLSPARLVGSGLSCTAEISELIGQQTGRSVKLTKQAFADTDTLLLEPAAALALDGRVRELPERFQLRLQGQRCWLLRTQTGERRVLSSCQCEVSVP